MNVIGMLLAFGAGLLILYVLGLFLVVPLKWLFRLFISSVFGFIMLAALNSVGMWLFGFTIPLNIVNVLIAGVLGVPGVVLIIILRVFF